jgi:hypothetical protein
MCCQIYNCISCLPSLSAVLLSYLDCIVLLFSVFFLFDTGMMMRMMRGKVCGVL